MWNGKRLPPLTKLRCFAGDLFKMLMFSFRDDQSCLSFSADDGMSWRSWCTSSLSIISVTVKRMDANANDWCDGRSNPLRAIVVAHIVYQELSLYLGAARMALSDIHGFTLKRDDYRSADRRGCGTSIYSAVSPSPEAIVLAGKRVGFGIKWRAD